MTKSFGVKATDDPVVIYHIRAAMPHKGGANSFYRVGDPRIRKTLCGNAITDHDIRFSWQADVVGIYEPCPNCCRIRDESRKSTAEMQREADDE